MDISSFKDINKVKAMFIEIYESFITEVKKVKNCKIDDVKNAFNRYFVEYLKKDYIELNGKVSRKQFWMFMLFSIILFGICWIISSYLFFVLFFVLFVPLMAITVRRLRDINLTIWLVVLYFIPIVSYVLLLICALPGDKEAGK